MRINSQLIEDAVTAFAKLPGIGKKTALRLVLHLLKQPPAATQQFVETLARMRNDIRFCPQCHYIADQTACALCADPTRDRSTICVVETVRDVMIIESTQQYRGLYHVLGGVINPLEGIGPDALTIDSLVARCSSGAVSELVMAISPTVEGDTTVFYISKKVAHIPMRITTLSRGISFGAELENTDDLTLARSIANRQPYQHYLDAQEK